MGFPICNFTNHGKSRTYGLLRYENNATIQFCTVSVCSNDGVTQLGLLGSDSDAMFEVVEISDACFVHLRMQYAPHAVVNRI